MAIFPVPLTSSVFLIASSDERVLGGKVTRRVYGRLLTITGTGAGSPWKMALASSSISCGVKPARAAMPWSTLKVMAGPLMVSSMPFLTSFTLLMVLMASPTLGPQVFSNSKFSENSLISMGLGELVRSPIMSSRTWWKSVSSCG